MKKLVLFVFTAFIAASGFSQTPDTTTYLSDKNIPPINIMQADSTWFTNANIPKNKPVVIIYFSPECGHCQLTAQELYSHIDELKDGFFIWVTYYSVPEIQTFEEKYKLGKLKNFRFGRDPRYAIPSFYKVKFTPFMAVYNTNGQLVETFEQGTTPEILAGLIKQAVQDGRNKGK
ncbi:MAG TPA: hypothetical protein VG738_07410 [Chitinophagaceae bacterium]|nr:hypothetical protein [Chitinophagaceae bacterium]